MKKESPEHTVSVVPTGPFDQIVSLCETFIRESRDGTPPSISSYLSRVAEDGRLTLFKNLLAFEIEHLREAGHQPALDEYLARFPQFASVIRPIFLELSSASFGVMPSTPTAGTDVKPPAATRLGDYRLLGELGRGGMGVVYEAVHVQRGHRVALKTLPSLDGAALHRFKREFRSLADVNHPNLVGLHTLEADGGQWFFTMDLLRGQNFLKHVRPAGTLDEARLRAALAQLVTAVMALHARHLVHRDLKPSNVMVTEDGRVVVLDFGLTLDVEGAGAHSGTADPGAGTPRYMAPEQAAGEAVTAACDWYAVGVMLYEALCGKSPFTGSLFQLMRDKQSLDPPPLPDDPRIPADLAALCRGLLARNPANRSDARAVVAAVAAQASTPAASPAGQHLVGRAQQLAALQDAHQSLLKRREPLTVFISGRSGEGKTTLAEHFLATPRRDRSSVVMAGRCYDRESVPFKALDMVIDTLCGYLRSLPEADAAMLVPDDVGVLAQVFPVLHRVEVVARSSVPPPAELDDQQVRCRAFQALRSLLLRVGRRSPVVWFIDDLQWGDADSAKALFEVLRPPEAPPVMFLGSYRADETEGSAFLKAWKEMQRKHDVPFSDREVKVGPLTPEECTRLVIDLVGRDDEVVRRRAAEFARETQGNPFLLTELVGCFDPDTDTFEAVPLHEVLARKLGRLPEEAGPLLEVVAVSGQGLPLEEAAKAAGHDLPPVATLTRMRNERLVRLVGSDERPLVDTYHDRVRETVLDRMDEGRCKTLHLSLAEVIERDAGGLSPDDFAALERGESSRTVRRAYDLAYHFDAAGESRKAWTYALLAAEQARRQFSLGVAVEQYAVARRNAAEAPDGVRYRIAVGCGEALMLLGHYDEAKARLGEAEGLTADPVERATVEGYQGEIAMKLGHSGASAALCTTALRRLGYWVPRSRLGWAWGLLRESAIHCHHRLFPNRLHTQAPTSRGNLTARLIPRLGYASFHLNSFKTLWALLAGMNYAERFPPSLPLAFSYTGYGGAVAGVRRFSRGVTYLERAFALRREANDLWGLAQSLFGFGFLLYSHARFEESIEKFDESLALYHKAGDQWEINGNRFHWAVCHEKLGNLSTIIDITRLKFTEGVRLGDHYCCHVSLYGWSMAARGHLPFEELAGLFHPLPDNVIATSMLFMAEGHWHWFHSRTEEALRAFESAYRVVRTTLAVNHLTLVTFPCLVTALRRHAEVVEGQDARQARHLRGRALRLAKWATWLTRFYPLYHPHTLRELALLLAARGKFRKALHIADRSCALAAGQKAKYEHAESLLARGQIARQLGLPEADDQIRTAQALLDERDRIIRELATVRPAIP